MKKRIVAPFSPETVRNLRAGDSVLISGVIYTARDAAHKRLVGLIEKGEDLPFALKDAVIYYAGPAPAREGQIIGSCGPTTSGRMDSFAPVLIERGLSGMIGKGDRSDGVVDAMKTHKAVYLAAVGGAGALLSRCVLKNTLVAFGDLGPEAVYELTVRDFPAVVAIDSLGGNLYQRRDAPAGAAARTLR